MDQSIGNIDFLSVTDINVETIMKKKNNARKSNKCNQCAYASSQAGDLRKHVKRHTGQNSNKCNQCDYASSQAGYLRKYLMRRHSEENENKRNN